MFLKSMYVYILRCNDGRYYIGVTNDLERRVEEHKKGLNPNCYTFKRRPVELAYYELFQSPAEAIAYEKKLKFWSNAKKTSLIEQNWQKLHELSKCKNRTSHELMTKNQSS